MIPFKLLISMIINERIGFFSPSDLLTYMTSGPVVALELVGANSVKNWRRLLGPTDSRDAREEAPGSVRAKFGKDKTNNAAHGSDSPEAAKRVRLVTVK